MKPFFRPTVSCLELHLPLLRYFLKQFEYWCRHSQLHHYSNFRDSMMKHTFTEASDSFARD